MIKSKIRVTIKNQSSPLKFVPFQHAPYGKHAPQLEMSTHSNSSQSISKAKRVFLLNLVLCTLLGAGFIAHHLSSSPEIEPTKPTEAIAEQEPQSALNLANIIGQAHGLAEDSRITYPLKKRRIIPIARKAIEQIELPPNIGVTHSQDALISAYIEGCYARFEEYYSDRDGYESGFLFGLKNDPEIYSMYSKRGLSRLLNRSKSIAFQKYSLNEIQLIIFTQGFIKGYEPSYLQTKEGITAQRGEPIDLIALKRLSYCI